MCALDTKYIIYLFPIKVKTWESGIYIFNINRNYSSTQTRDILLHIEEPIIYIYIYITGNIIKGIKEAKLNFQQKKHYLKQNTLYHS